MQRGFADCHAAVSDIEMRVKYKPIFFHQIVREQMIAIIIDLTK